MNILKNNKSLGLMLGATAIVLVVSVITVVSSDRLVFQSNNNSRNLAAVGEVAKGTPDQPTNLLVTDNGDLSVSVSWDEPKSSGDTRISSYVVYYSTIVDGKEVTGSVSADRSPANIDRLEDRVTYDFSVAAINEQGEGLSSEIVTVEIREDVAVEFTVDAAVVTVAENGLSANIALSTSTNSFYSVKYSPVNISTKGKAITESETSATSHSVDISNLSTCSKYFFYITFTEDSEASTQIEQSGEFSTAGCTGGSSILSISSDNVTSEKVASLETNSSSRKIAVEAPTSLKAGETDVYIQAAKLDKDSVQGEISTPSGKLWAGDQAYSLKAFDSNVEEIDGSFDKPVTVSIDYVEADIEGLDIDSLKIYHYEDGAGWQELSSCSNELSNGAGVITCSTTSFSIFGLFGEEPEPEPQAQSSGSSGSSGSVANSQLINTVAVETPIILEPLEDNEVLEVQNTNTENSQESFSKDLWYGLKDEDVKILQQSLNQLGFKLSESGSGSGGSETTYFGPKTKSAVIRFQEKYKDSILSPLGLVSGTGYFGPYTRAMIKSLLGV